jgi:hypothetical protein
VGAAALLAALSAGAGQAAAATFYVSPSGSDRASGRSAAAAWKTVQRVNRASLSAGDRVLFQGGGVWAEMLEPEGDGARGNPIVFGTYGSGKAVLTGQGARGYAGIAVIRRGWLRFENLELRDRSGQDILVYIEGAHDVVFDRMLLRNAYGGFHSSPQPNSERITVQRSRILNMRGGDGAHGINVPRGDTGWLVTDTEIAHVPDSCLIDLGTGSRYIRMTVHDCGFGTSAQGAHGLYLRGPSLTVRDSHVWNARTSCVSVRFQGDRVLRNRLHGCGFGVSFFDYATAQGEVQIARNRIWDTRIGIYADNTQRIGFAITNNTILGGRADGRSGEGINLAWVRSARITNTIVTGNADPALRVDHAAAGYRERNNAFHVGSARPFIYGQNAPLTFAAYRRASGQGAGSTTADPALVDPSRTAPNLLLRPTSPLRDRGTAASAIGPLAQRCDGGLLSFCGSAPDVGAVELRG